MRAQVLQEIHTSTGSRYARNPNIRYAHKNLGNVIVIKIKALIKHKNSNSTLGNYMVNFEYLCL